MIEYRIYESVYENIISGKKNIEVRLQNDKSNKIKIGDKIKFQVLDKEIYLQVEVTNKYIYDDFEEFWKDKDIVLSSAKNYTKEECKNKLYEIFGKERVNNSKLVAIEFKIINN
ncbi:MAG: ASCH domain-containing protein [Bacilli bacterium]|nr:ASCH domain-containing protein [Bacilli bacterium]